MAGKAIDDIVADDLAADPALPGIPDVDVSDPDSASVAYSQHRTKLSTHRTALSEHRSKLSNQRTEMSRRRTGMSFQRTRMSAERTLMSVIRTSLSLISFGFTIYQFFRQLQDKNLLAGDTHAARNFGLALIYLGVGIVVAGILYHLQFMLGLRRERNQMRIDGHVHAASHFPVSFTLIVALALLVLGVVAVANLTFQTGPFG